MTRRLPLRFWGGAFPCFSLPAAAEAASDDRDVVSEPYFGSDAVARLRTELRLKLQETPTRCTSAAGAIHGNELLALADQYAAHVLALLRYVNTTDPSSGEYVPLFFGFGETDLRTERFVGRERRLAFAVPVDAVLTIVLRAQLHARHAEALVEQGLTLQSEPIVAAAEASWRASTREFTRAASVASATLEAWATGDPSLASLAKFLTSLSTQCIVLARVTQMHRAAARILSLILLDETVERLARNAAVCARYAHTVAMEARDVAGVLDDSSLSRQLSWLVQTYGIRWRAIVYSYEQTVFQLDFHPEIAIHFGEMVQRGERPPPLPDHCRRRDANFTRVAHELQQSHTAHLNELLDEKAALLTLCQRKLGAAWMLQPLPREIQSELEAISSFDGLFGDEDDPGERTPHTETEPDESLSVEAIQQNVQNARLRTGLETLSISAYSMRAIADEETTQNAPSSTSTQVATTSQLHKTTNSNEPIAVSVRPSSAGSTLTSLTKRLSAPASSEWVTMRVGDKVLHFEPLPTPAASTRPPRPLTAGTGGERRRNAVPMVVDGDGLTAASPIQAKPRPSSSQSYLSSKRRSPADAGGKTITWVPTRAPCALCERRFTRQNLPGVVVMKRIFDLRRKWGMVLQDSKKFSAASALYGKASVCMMCQDILTFEDDKDAASNNASTISFEAPLDDVGMLIRNRILHSYLQLPPTSDEMLLDVAVDKRARQSSTNFGLAAHNAVLAEPLRTAHTKEEFQPWWEVDLGNYYVVHSIKVWLREDTCHVFSAGGNHASTMQPHRKMGIDVPSNAIPLSSIGFSQSGSGPGVSSGTLTPGNQPNVGLYPLHLCISMKTGVDRDLDDVLVSAVSTHCVREKIVQPLVWLTPPNCRGRFVRIQSEATAFLHIEKVNVFVAQEMPAARTKKENARRTLKRAAFRASVISKKLAQNQPTADVQDGAIVDDIPIQPKGFASAFADPEQAEKRRISRLYLKFKNLLDARSKYVVDERHVSFEN